MDESKNKKKMDESNSTKSRERVHCRVVSNAALRLHRSVLIRFRFDFDYTVLHYEMDQDVDISTIAPQVNRECKYMWTLTSKRTQDT